MPVPQRRSRGGGRDARCRRHRARAQTGLHCPSHPHSNRSRGPRTLPARQPARRALRGRQSPGDLTQRHLPPATRAIGRRNAHRCRHHRLREMTRHAPVVSLPFPEPAIAVSSRAEVFLGYLEYFRFRLVSKLEALPSGELRRSRLPSGWTPIELLKHVAHDELRWLEWRFAGRCAGDPWADDRDGRWYVAGDETLQDLVEALHAQAARSRAVVESH